MESYVPPAANYKNLPTYSTFVSRGCPYKCNFCNAGDVFGTLGRYRPLDMVTDELKYLQKYYNMKGMYFMDGTFATNQKWVNKFCDEVISDDGLNVDWFTWTRTDLITPELARKMKKSGCWKVGVGVESGNQQSLDLLRKGMRVDQVKKGITYFQDAGIQVNCSFMLGIPGETIAHVENTLRFAKELKTESAIFFLPVPMPGGELYDLAREYGGLRETGLENWTDYSTFNFENPIYINPLIGHKKMVEYYDSSFSRFFLDPFVIWRNLKTIENVDDVFRLMAGFKSIKYFFNPTLLAKSLTQRFIAYQGTDKANDSNQDLQLPPGAFSKN
jgi:anaerobic magnesium-protoporphyrin IX monomethyl ester cyclase